MNCPKLKEFIVFFLFCSRITANDLIFKTWKNIEHKRITDLTRRSQDITQWILGEIVTVANLKKRVVVLAKFLEVADELFKLRNFSSVMDFYFALSHFTVSRLKRTWKRLRPASLEI